VQLVQSTVVVFLGGSCIVGCLKMYLDFVLGGSFFQGGSFFRMCYFEEIRGKIVEFVVEFVG